MDEEHISELSKIDLALLRGLIYEKISLAKSLKIDVNLRVPCPISKVNMEELDLVKSLGIILDNAIEEVTNKNNAYIIFDILNFNDKVTFSVENSIEKEKIDINNLSSTKGYNRGYGLLNLKEILSKYKNVDFTTESFDFKFVQVITIR